MDVRFFFLIFLRRLPVLVILTLIGLTIGFSIAMSLPPTYRSDAVLIAESEQISDELAATTVQANQIETLQIIQQRILSRSTLLEMANRMGIYDDVEGADQMSADQKVNDLRARIGIEIQGGTSRVRRGNVEATIVRVSFEAPSAQLSAKVANEVVTLILQENVEMRTETTRGTLDFFIQEVERLEQSLSRVSGDILAFKQANLGALPDSLDFRRTQLSSLQQRLMQLQQEQTALRDRRGQLVSLFEATGSTTLGGQGGLTPEAQRLAELRQEFASLSAVLSEDNPRMALMRTQIAAAERALSEVSEGDAEAAQSSGSVSESLFQIQIAEIDAQIVYKDEERARIETQIADLTQTIEATPANALTLETLERDYANLQSRYNQAVAAKAQAETGNIIESQGKSQRITVVEQATPPDRPTSPNRPVIALGGMGAGMLLGAAIIAVLELLNNAIRRPQDIRNALGVEVFATIPYIRTEREIWRRRTVFTGLALVCLIGLPAVLWYIDAKVAPLAPMLDNLLSRINIASL